ncbi:MAG: PII-interacting protein PipX family protein, partial [Cyanobacteria bacterium J06576_12]
MSNENYLNHPNFGLLFRVCLVGEGQEPLVTTKNKRCAYSVANSS